jgi:hypothetical protein
MKTRKLYHFTSRWVLPRIMREGIVRGDVPITMTTGYTAPWLTDDPRWDQQGWKGGSFLDKSEVRITVKVSEARLSTWAEIVEQQNVEDGWARVMIESARRPEDVTWFVHNGPVLPKAFAKVEFRSGLRPLDATTLPDDIRHLEHTGTPTRHTRTVWKTMSREAFLKDCENWIRSPNMQYPWSDMPAPLLRALARSSPELSVEVGQRFCKKAGIDLTGGLPDDPRYGKIDRTLPALMTMHGVSRWLNSSRRLIDVSTSSVELLHAWEPRFESLPMVEEQPWRHGVMFRFEDPSLRVMMYVEVLEGAEPGVRYTMWIQDRHKRWGTVLPKEFAPISGEDWEPPLAGSLDTYTRFDHSLRAKSRMAIAEDGTRIDLARLRHVAINALAAINEEPSIILGSRKAPRNRKKKRSAGPVNRVRRLTLSYDGARMVTRRWVILPTPEQTEKIEHKPHKTPCLHTVVQHYWRPWVNTPKTFEKVLETRQRQRLKNGKVETYTQYRVRRLRGPKDGFSRGKGVEVKQARLVTDISDLSMPGGGS